MKTDIILAGVGGQGILSIATIIGAASLRENLFVKQAEVHGMSQRGGDVQSNLRISDRPIASDLIPLGGADLIISLEPMEALRYLPYLKRGGCIVTNTTPFVNIPDYPTEEEMAKALSEAGSDPDFPLQTVCLDMDAIAKRVASPRSSNMVLLGAASPFLPLSMQQLEDAVAAVFGSKGESIVEQNRKALAEGRRAAEELLEI